MNFYIFIKQAFWSIKANKLRSFLSTLGIIIGISSFVIMLSLWEWAKESIKKEFSWSTDVITLTKKESQESLALDIINNKLPNIIKQKVPNVSNVFTLYNTYLEAVYNDKNLNWTINWIDKWYLQFKKIQLEYWNYFDKNNFLKSEKVAIIWNKLVKKNFENENPIWKHISIWWEPFLVTWILKKKSWKYDYNIFIPSATINNILNVNKIDKIEIIVKDQNKISSTKDNLNYFLWKKSFTQNMNDVKFRTRTDDEELKMANEIIGKISLLLAWIWAIALIVGWIWIMNIMLVSVTERTREIGIRKAIWATNRIIMLQFLIESIILTLIWSIIALWFSHGAVYLIWTISAEFQPIINMNVILIATWVAVSMWVIFWLMPAYKAAKLKIIDALSFE